MHLSYTVYAVRMSVLSHAHVIAPWTATRSEEMQPEQNYDNIKRSIHRHNMAGDANTQMKKFEFNHKFERENAAFLWLIYVDGIKCERR